MRKRVPGMGFSSWRPCQASIKFPLLFALLSFAQGSPRFANQAFSQQRQADNPPASANASGSKFGKELARIAQEQYTIYHSMRESDPQLAAQIETYWTVTGLAFPGVKTPWSAVFVSWCMYQAGATKEEFLFSPLHAEFVHAATQNTLRQRGVFRAYDIRAYAPEIGDVVQNNRGGNTYDYEYARQHAIYFSHSAIVVAKGQDAQGKRYLVTIGGNENDSVGRKVVWVDKQGKIIQRQKASYICIIRTLKR